jgi:hypothetical protein
MSTSACALWAPRHGLDAAGACPRPVTYRPCMTSTRAIQARFESCIRVSRGPRPTWRQNIRIKLVVLVVYPTRPHCATVRNSPRNPSVKRLQGSSSFRFSKNLLPYWSWPINVPALVSPAPCQRLPCVSRGSSRAYQCSVSASVSVSRVWE